MHTINPIAITLLFTLVISDAKIRFRESFYALAPLLVYSALYFVMVFIYLEQYLKNIKLSDQ